MMKIVKSYNEEGRKYQFDSKKMLMYSNQMKYDLQKKGKKKNKSSIMEELAEKLFVSVEAVKSWMYGANGPSDLEQVKQIADYFGVEYHQLLKEEEKMATNNNFNMVEGMANEAQLQYTKEKVREIYGAMVDCINAVIDFYYTENPDEDDDLTSPEFQSRLNMAYNLALCSRKKADRLLEKAMLDIPEALFDQIHVYLWTDLQNILDDAIHSFEPIEWVEGMDEMNEIEDEDAAIRSESIHRYKNGGYIEDLRKIFKDYIVK